MMCVAQLLLEQISDTCRAGLKTTPAALEILTNNRICREKDYSAKKTEQKKISYFSVPLICFTRNFRRLIYTGNIFFSGRRF